MDRLNELNPPQSEAAEYTEGPLLILAGAGSGKTRVLIYRIAHLIRACGVEPYNILAVTFTNKAADQLKERVARLLGPAAHRVWVSTFHSLGAQILRQHITKLGYERNFAIYDQDDSLTLIKRIMKEKDLDPKQLNPRLVASWIESVKREVQAVDDLESEGRGRKQMKEIYREYQSRLMIANAVDFNDLLLLLLRLLEHHPDALEHYQNRFRYIMVDEYQDTNRVQYLIVRKLAERFENLCVVGDEDQSIYGWRGANIENILNFTKDFPKAKTVKLEQNYRSTKMIIQAASGLIGYNAERTPKELWTENPRGDLVRIRRVSDEKQEASWVVEEIMRQRSNGRSLQDIAIFYRTHAQSRQFEDKLRGMNLNYAIYGGTRFYDRKEIKDVLAYLKVVSNPRDDISLLRIINVPARGVGAKTLDMIQTEARMNGVPSLEAVRVLLREGRFGKKAGQNLLDLTKLLDDLKARAEAGEESLPVLLDAVIVDSGYKGMLEKEGSVEAESRLENLEELIGATEEYANAADEPSLEGFLEKVSLYSELDNFVGDQGQVTMMTLHTAKGLEFPLVFMVGMEENMFPHIRSLVSDDPTMIEEERRLAYVGMTRAREQLMLTHAAERSFRGRHNQNEPSRFLDEVPPQFVKREGKIIKPIKSRYEQSTSSMDFGDSRIEYNATPSAHSIGEIWDPASEMTLKLGMTIKHPSLGVGVIRRIEGQDDAAKISIQFGKKIKKIALGYVTLELVKSS